MALLTGRGIRPPSASAERREPPIFRPNMITSAKHLVFHGTLVLLFGLLLGAPYGKAINSGAPAHIVNSWRIAHQSLPIAAILMFSVAVLLSSFSVPETVSWFIAGCLIASSYFFSVSMPLAAITGHRGLT